MKKRLCLLLALLTFGSMLLTSCAKGKEFASSAASTITSEKSDNTTEAAVKETVNAAYRDDLGEYNFDGKTFNFLLYGDGVPEKWSEIDVIADQETGETINDGIYRRNITLEERLNIKINGIYNLNATGKLKEAVQAGDSVYDAAFLQMGLAGSSASSGYVYDWKNIPHVDLTKAYWDRSIMRDLSVGGKIYFLTGDISTIDNQATWIMMFNKNMVSTYNLESPYGLVYNGKWTIDKFSEMTKNITRDLDGDGAYTVIDMYGLSTTPDTVYGLFYSTGLTFISKDAKDYPYFNLDVEKGSKVLEKTGNLFNKDNQTLLSTRIASQVDNVITGIRTAFIEDRALFYAEVMFHVANLREMETDFGIIPMPKYDEAQENYITFVNPAGSCLVIPVTCADTEYAGVVIEAMASASYQYLTPAYYDTALKGKYARDDESSDMLDLLLQNRVYDLALIYGWGSIASSYNQLAINGSIDLSSLVAKSESSINKSIEDFIDAFKLQH